MRCPDRHLHYPGGRRWVLSAVAALALVQAAAKAEQSAVFGKEHSSEAALIGILYDFKQNQKRQSTGFNVENYPRVIEEFLEKGWSESVLNRYFRATRPLYTTQIYIPLMGAGEAPKAFDMEKVIKPSAWVIYYKGQVSPPEDGNYRFLGYSDDLLAVAVNGKTVCIGARMELPAWKVPPGGGPFVPATSMGLTYGDWIPLKKDEPIDLDVLIGERPGGGFCAFLLYEKQGEKYPVNEQGVPMYPIFQLAPYNTPVPSPGEGTPFSPSDKIWKGHQ